ncbi:MAG: S9 family peptidase [Clostridia bacterium]|nr:S9 family peptidase [Clostridia bacterium]MBQ5813970.1 S9 family peptidase [Clostridia bacterium]
MNKITVDSFLKFKFVSNPGFSPDGKYVAFVVNHACKASNGYKGNIHLLETETGKVRQLTNGGDAKAYCWTDNGTLLFAAPRCPKVKEALAKGENVTAIYEISPEGGEAVHAFNLPVRTGGLTNIGEGKYMLTSVYDNRYPNLEDKNDAEKAQALESYTKPAYEVFEELPFWGNGQGVIDGKRTRLYIYDSVKDEIKAITGEWFQVDSATLAHGKIVIKGGEWHGKRYVMSGIYVYDLKSKRMKEILKPDKMRTGAVGLFDENTMIAAASDGKLYGSEQYMDFYTVDLKTKKFTKLADYEASIGASSVGSDARIGGGRGFKVEGDKAYFITTVDDSAFLRVIDREGKIEDVYAEIGTVDNFDVKDGNVIFAGMYGNKLGELYCAKGNQLTHFNDEFLATHSVVTPEYHTFTASDGFEIHGWAMKPVGYVEGKKYPAILHIHGGPRTVFGNVFHHEMQMWANAGYFVFFSNPRGSDGRGNEFGYISGKYGTVEYDNLMEFCDEMIKLYPDVDVDNFGVTGGSYGGFMTNWIIGHTNRFKAAASQRSISNWIAFEHTTDIGYFFTPNQMLATTRTDYEKLWWHSPLKYADKATTPTLFIHSDEDFRCWMVEGLSMFTALKMHGVESRLCLFKGENHELSRGGKPRNRIRRMEEIVGWMDKHLKK